MFEHYTQFAKSIGSGILSLGLFVSSLLGATPTQIPQPLVGGSVLTPDVIALYEDSLATRITSSATSMTLVRGTDKEGVSLASSTYAFIIDEGLSTEEFVVADCTAKACTNLARGISVTTGTTSVASLKQEHGRGASVKITDAPSLVFAVNVLKGKQNIENTLRYDSSIVSGSFTDTRQIVNKGYVDGVAFSGAGVIDATSAAKGVVELATGVEQASSTANGSSGPLVIAAANATSSCASAVTAPLKALITDNTGKIASNCFPSGIPLTTGNNTWTGTNAFATSSTATTTIGAFPAWEIGKQKQVFTSSGTWTVPMGITRVKIEAIGGGGGSGSGTNDTAGGGGGGAGSYCVKWADVSATTTIGITIGTGGAGGPPGAGVAGGTTVVSSYCNAGGGSGGARGNAAGGAAGGAGGTATLGDVNVRGGGGGFGTGIGTGTNGGAGGSNIYGGGGSGVADNANTCAAGGSYGGGASGATSSAGEINGCAGADGIVIISW